MMNSIPLGPFTKDSAYGEALRLDQADPLAQFREAFVAPDPDLIYLDGNSLGRLPLDTATQIRNVVDHEWGEDLIRSWPARWWNRATEIGAQIAPLIGAAPTNVVVADATSVALFKLTVGALLARADRQQILTDDLNFPTDLYVTSSAAALCGNRSVVAIPSEDGLMGPEDALIAAMNQDTALVTLSHIAFKSGYLYNMKRITAAAHEVGALVLWDLSHSVGAIPIDLASCSVDLAVGCTYKYLNGGPGAPAFLYVAPGLEIENPLAGWWGHEDPFSFNTEYVPSDKIQRFQTGTMPILSLSAIEPAVRLTSEAGMEAIRSKSIALSEFFIRMADRLLDPLGFTLASPRTPERRGSHVSLKHTHGWQVAQAMIGEANVIPDFRAPDNIRFGFAPLYTSFVDVHTSVLRIVEVFAAGSLDKYPATPSSVS